MKFFFPYLVNGNQSSFVQGRIIQDNILLMHEFVKKFKHTRGPNGCAVKVDIMNGFNTVIRKYVMDILQSMNFPSQFRKWVYLCISTASFSIKLNGSLTGNFQASINGSNFKYYPKYKLNKLTSLSFADDLFILASVKEDSVKIIKDSLKKFEGFLD